MRPITALIPVPQTVRLGEKEFVVSPLRLSDLARLQDAIERRDPHPIAATRPKLAGAAPAERREMLRAALFDGDDWPIRLGDARSSEFTECETGAIDFISIALARHRPGLTWGEALGIATTIEPGQYSALRRVAFGITPQEEVESLLGLSSYAGGGAERPNWNEAIDELAREMSWTYEYIYSLSLAEFFNARAHGKTPVRVVKPLDGETPADTMARVRVALYGEI